MPNHPPIAIYLPYFDNGGVERMLVNLALGMASLGQQVQFIVCKSSRPYLATLSGHAELIELGEGGPSELIERTATYLRNAQPCVLLTAKEPDIALASAALVKSGISCRLYIRAVTNHLQRLRYTNFIRRWYELRNIRHLYRKADGIVAVSNGVADDVRHIVGKHCPSITTARNPVITDDLFRRAQSMPSHPWFDGDIPIILGIGRFSRAKNFPLLLEAFAQVRQQRPCRLILLGKGRQQGRLEQLSARLGVAQDVDMPGYVENPYPYLRHASLFVLSSLWEGSPNVLTEALALGCPVVATDCPSGPREILQDGKFGSLVPMNDATALAQAMLDTLRQPPSAEALRQATLGYTTKESARQYLQAMGIPCHD